MRGQPRLLVLRGGAIGDFIVTLPALSALRARWPEAYIELLSYPHVARLALADRLVDKVRSLDEAAIARLFAAGAVLPAEQTAYLRSFDLVISYLYDPDQILRTNVTLAGVRQLVAGTPLVKEEHAVDHMFKPLMDLAIYPQGQEAPSLRAEQETLERMGIWMREQGLGPRALALHPGSGSPRKNWPLGRFYELARRLQVGSGWNPFFILGEAEEEAAAFFAQTEPSFPVCQGRQLPEVLALLQASAAYVGNDSGITHLAAAAGIQVLALFGPSNPDLWSPRGAHVHIVRAPQDDLRLLTLPDVMEFLA